MVIVFQFLTASPASLRQVVQGDIYVWFDVEHALSVEWDAECCCMGSPCHANRIDILRQNRYKKSFHHNAMRMVAGLQLLDHILKKKVLGFRAIDFELVFCGTDGEPPKLAANTSVLQPLGCAEDDHPATPWPEWGRNRHDPLSIWESTMTSRIASAVELSQARPVAVFRGGANKIKHSCNQAPVQIPNGRHSRFIHVNSSNWRKIGTRLKLLHLRQERPDLLNVNLRESLSKLGGEYGIDLSNYSVDAPHTLSMNEQAQQFRYTISIGRKNCWADRLRYLLLSPQV